MPVHAVPTTRYLRWLFAIIVGAAVLFPSLVLLGVPDTPQHGWSTSAGDVLWLTTLFAPGPAVLGWYGNYAIDRAERGVPGWPAPPVIGGAVVTAVAQKLLAGSGVHPRR